MHLCQEFFYSKSKFLNFIIFLFKKTIHRKQINRYNILDYFFKEILWLVQR